MLFYCLLQPIPPMSRGFQNVPVRQKAGIDKNMKQVKTFTYILSWVLCVVVFIAAAGVGVSMFFGCRLLCISTGSMEPTYPVGAIIFVTPTEPEELSEGDVITFVSGGVLITHRIVSIDEGKNLIYTKGDNNNTDDSSPVPYENVVGRVAFGIDLLGYPVLFARTKLGKIVYADVIVLIILVRLVARYLESDDCETA